MIVSKQLGQNQRKATLATIKKTVPKRPKMDMKAQNAKMRDNKGPAPWQTPYRGSRPSLGHGGVNMKQKQKDFKITIPHCKAISGKFISFPVILALSTFISLHFGFWGFISLHFGFVGVHFLAFSPFGGQLVGSHPQVAAAPGPAPFSQFFTLFGLHFFAFWPCGFSFPCILALRAFISLHFGLVGLHFLAFWPCRGPSFPCLISLHYQRRGHFAVFNLLGLHFLAFWPCGPSFPCILALWAFISLHFGLVGFHFLAFWPCGPLFPCILALWASISLHFGLVGLHFVAFWHCGPSFRCILALWAFISLHFGIVGLYFLAFWHCGSHFLAFWPCGPLFPCILALWAFISFHFGLFGVSFWGPPPTSCQKWHVCPTSLQWIYQRRDRLHFAVSRLLSLHFLAFWPCGPSFPCILALWAFISLHFGLVGLSFPCILALWGCISLHFGVFGVSFWGSSLHKLPKMARLPNVLTMDLSAP